jgi:tRNA 5-methylaminomethyl-2-thiouridine biosynthesis bifunctional protein
LTEAADIRIAKLAALVQKNGLWCAMDGHGKEIARAEFVVLANGAFAVPGVQLPKLRLLRGQISVAEASGEIPQIPKVGQSYALALSANQVLFGATHDRVDEMTDTQTRPQDHVRNLAGLAALFPELAAGIDLGQIGGRTSYRAASPDLQPLAGPVVDAKQCAIWSKQHWGKLRSYASAPVIEGLFMLNGLGSRGLTLAPLLAESIAAMICEEPSPLEREAAAALHPGRFAARAARRG